MYPTSYEEALAICKTRKRKIANNTYLVADADPWIGIKLHRTIVVKFYKDGSVELDSGGWKTPTTKDRMNCAGVQVFQCLNEWYVNTRKGKFIFLNGMKIDKNGNCDTDNADLDEDRKAYRREKYRQNREQLRMRKLRKSPLYKTMLGLSQVVGEEDRAKLDSVIDKVNPKLPIYKPR